MMHKAKYLSHHTWGVQTHAQEHDHIWMPALPKSDITDRQGSMCVAHSLYFGLPNPADTVVGKAACVHMHVV